VHIVRLEQDEVVHNHLCAACAERSVEEPDGAAIIFAMPAALRGVVARLLERTAGDPGDALAGSRACAVCGTTLSDLRETGMVGCAACYSAHAEEIEAALQAPVAGEYVGKVPRRAPERVQLRQEVLRLERMLGELVADERFEEAAGVRDRLNALAVEMRASGD
jgi:protein arginine kinase activator